MKKIGIGVGIVIIIVVLVGVKMWQQQSEKNITVETTNMLEETMTDTVMAQGKLELASQQKEFFQADKGEVEEVFVKEGEEVEKGAKLFRYESNELSQEQKENELQQQSNYLELNQLKDQHAELDKQLEKDKDNDQLQEEHDQRELEQQQKNIDIEQTTMQQESVEKRLDALIVKSEMDGTIVTVNEQAASGSEEMQQEPLIRVGTLNKLIVTGGVSEYDTLKIKNDQPVKLTSDVLPDESWKGVVKSVAFLPEDTNEMDAGDDSDGAEYPIEVTVEDKDMDLKPGFQILMEIETSKEKANVLPISAVKQQGNDSYVFVVKDEKAEQREVKVGTVTDDTIEIKDGLTEEDPVITDLSDELQDGMEVTVK